MQALFHLQELLDLALEHLLHRDSSPARNDAGDVFIVDLFLQQAMILLQGDQLAVFGVELLLQRRALPVFQPGGPLEIRHPLRPFCVQPQLLQASFDFPDLLDQSFLVLPLRAHRPALLLQIGQLFLDRAEPVLRRPVLLLLERLAFDLQLTDLSLDFIQFTGQTVDLHAEAGGGLIDQVDGFVRQEAVGDVSLGEHGGGHDRRVGDPHPVVDFILLLQPAQDRNRVLDRWLTDEDRLEAALQRRVLLDVLAVFVQRGGADATKLASRQGRFQQVRGVHRPFSSTGSHQGVEFVNKEDDLAVRGLDLFEERLEAVLKLAPVLGTRDQ